MENISSEVGLPLLKQDFILKYSEYSKKGNSNIILFSI